LDEEFQLTCEVNVRKIKLASVLAIAVLAVAFVAWTMSEEPSKPAAIEWLNFENAHAKTVKEKKLMMVDVYTDWCKWCKVMDEQTFSHPDIVKFARQNMVMSKMNAESDAKVRFRDKEYTQRQLAAGLGVSGYPTVVFFDANGDLITNVSGFIPADKFLPILEYLHGRHYEKKVSFEAFLESRKK